MTTTIELSFYPFQDQYRATIKEFIRRLKGYTDLRITVGPTSTVMVGEHARAVNCIKEMMEWSHANQGSSVFVAKFLLDYNPS